MNNRELENKENEVNDRKEDKISSVDRNFQTDPIIEADKNIGTDPILSDESNDMDEDSPQAPQSISSIKSGDHPKDLRSPEQRTAMENLRKSLNEEKRNDNTDNECAICKLDFSGITLYIECGHRFHTHCIKTWVEKRPECPVCRNSTKVFEEELSGLRKEQKKNEN